MSKYKEIFKRAEIDLEVFKASSALELKTILNIPFGKIKMLKIKIEKMDLPKVPKSPKGFLCPFCGKSWVSAQSLQKHIDEKHGGGYADKQINESVTLDGEVSNDQIDVSMNEIEISNREDAEQDVEAETLDEECDYDISMNSIDRSDMSIDRTNEEGEEEEDVQNEEKGEEEGVQEEVQYVEEEVDNTAPKEAGQQEEYPCVECESVFSFKLPLKLHIKNNHTGKLKCDQCAFRTNTIRKIEEHEQNLHGLIDGEAVLEERTGLLAMVENIFDFGNQKKNQKKSKKKQEV